MSAGLVERGLTTLAHEIFLFTKRDMICVAYVDDTIFVGPDRETIEHEINILGIPNNEYRQVSVKILGLSMQRSRY